MWPSVVIASHFFALMNKPCGVPWALTKATSAAITAAGPPKMMSSMYAIFN